MYHPHLTSPHQGDHTGTIVPRAGLQCGHLTEVITMVVQGPSHPGDSRAHNVLTSANDLAANQEILSAENRALSFVFLQPFSIEVIISVF